MRMTLGESVRAAAAALMRITGESQTDLAAALGVSQTQISRRQSGSAAWSLNDCEALAAHYGVDVLDLLAGPTRACDALAPQRRSTTRTAAEPTAPAPAQGPLR
ncbi:helix-turn-helix transcriptional regulator [Streptomyces sp. NPDC051576]|uniref:helix-turn-helix transcriptional regulator n=1 Tax=Streptomyces sp. NPDC051576 TaxID=3155803 RepID=UPI00342DE5C9